jgi:hypothetical protein
MHPHVRQEGADVGELAPFVAGHFVEQRAFAVDHFIVRLVQGCG